MRSEGLWNSKDALSASSTVGTSMDEVIMQISVDMATLVSELGEMGVLKSRPAPIFVCDPFTMRQVAAFSLCSS